MKQFQSKIITRFMDPNQYAEFVEEYKAHRNSYRGDWDNYAPTASDVDGYYAWLDNKTSLQNLATSFGVKTSNTAGTWARLARIGRWLNRASPAELERIEKERKSL